MYTVCKRVANSSGIMRTDARVKRLSKRVFKYLLAEQTKRK